MTLYVLRSHNNRKMFPTVRDLYLESSPYEFVCVCDVAKRIILSIGLMTIFAGTVSIP